MVTMIRACCLVLLGVTIFLFATAGGATSRGVVVHFFTASGCPHCAEGEAFLEDLRERYPALEIREYEIWNNRPNFDLLLRLSSTFGSETVSTPTFFIGNRIWTGFSQADAQQVEAAVRTCLEQGCPDPLKRLESPEKAVTEEPSTLTLPVLGEVNAQRVSIPVLTVVLGLLDSFNPCAFFVLLFLLSLLVHARSRRRMFLVGGVFIFCSGLVYFLFMAAWLGIFRMAGQVRWITIAAGVFAVFFALINIKDFFLFKKGITFSIPESAKPHLFRRMRSLVQAESLWSVLPGTVLLALAANSYELLCTAGFPMVYTRVLTLQDLPGWQYTAWLVAYNLVYIVPLLVILVGFTVTLGAHKLSEEQGRVLKLVSGMMMLVLGTVLLVDPSLLNRLWAAAGLLGSALLASALVWWVWERGRT